MRAAAARPAQVKVVFTDEASFSHQPSSAKLWARRGRRQPPVRQHTTSDRVLRLVGLLDAASGRVQVWDCPRLTAARLAACWRQLSAQYPAAERIYVVMDNWPVHRHATVRRAWQAQSRVQVLFLPTYAPWLNNIEKLWKWLRQRVTHAHPWAADFATFREHLLAECAALGAGSAALRAYCGLNKVFS